MTKPNEVKDIYVISRASLPIGNTNLVHFPDGTTGVAFKQFPTTGTPPDLQLKAPRPTDANDIAPQLNDMGTELRERGATWLQITAIDDLYYMEGWFVRPAVEAAFDIMEASAS